MSKTPRTDEREFAAIDLKPSSRVVYASLARQLETELAEAQAEIENLKWHINSEKAKAEAALALNDRALGLVNEARADADHWKSECNALQRMVHEARAEIEKLNNLFANGIECFMTPCDKHSGENTPPFAEFMEKYGHKCTPCLVESLKEARAEVINLAEVLAEKENLLDNALAERDEAKAEIVRLNKELSDIASGVVNDGVKIFEQKRLIEQMREALEAVVRVADRATVEFDMARSAIKAAKGEI